TNRVPRGTKLEVVGEDRGGWLKVKPPPGSASLIAARFLSEGSADGKVRVVAAGDDGVDVFMGSQVPGFSHKRPTVKGARAKTGSLVACLRLPANSNAGFGDYCWIKPLPSEVRYVRKEAVQGGTSPSFVPAGGLTPAGTPATPSAVPIAQTPSANASQS